MLQNGYGNRESYAKGLPTSAAVNCVGVLKLEAAANQSRAPVQTHACEDMMHVEEGEQDHAASAAQSRETTACCQLISVSNELGQNLARMKTTNTESCKK